jgi:peptide deformylase
MVKPIVQIGTPILTTKTTEVKDYSTAEVKQLIVDLIDTCNNQRKITAGLSAPQINSGLRICICRRIDLEEIGAKKLADDQLWQVMINPHILEKGKRESTYWEGCLSIGQGPNGLYGPVTRADSAHIEFIDRSGGKQVMHCKGFFAHVVQHELDHLDGILFTKYIDNPANLWKSKDLDAYYNEYGDYPPVN